jgi:hypothetical protein
MSKILCIYPDDSSTKFLNRIQTHLKNRFGNEFHCFKVKPNQESHEACLERIQSSKTEETIIFLGHGGSDYLFGACNRTDMLSESDGLYDDTENFCMERFINRDNIGVFKGKKVFCLSCNSAPTLARLAVTNGAKVFAGFQDIPTAINELEEYGAREPLRLIVARFKGELVWIIKHSLSLSIVRNYSFYQLADRIKLLTNDRMNKLIFDHKNLRERRLIADYLFKFKDGMLLVGDKSETIRS